MWKLATPRATKSGTTNSDRGWNSVIGDRGDNSFMIGEHFDGTHARIYTRYTLVDFYISLQKCFWLQR